MNNCPNCGLNLEPDALYCGNCGFKLINETNPAITGSIPAYAHETLTPTARRGEILSTIGLLLGVIAIPSALFIPIVGLGLGVAGIVLSTIGRAKFRHLLSLMATGISVLGIIAAVVVWGIVISRSTALKIEQGSAQQTTKLISVDTPCYSVMIDSGLNNYSPNNCNFDAASTAEEFSVNAVNNPNVTPDNLAQVAPGIFKQAVANSGNTLISGLESTFANSPAYVVYVNNAAQNTKGIFAMVFHQSTAGDNVYIVGRVERTTFTPTFGPLESQWQWK